MWLLPAGEQAYLALSICSDDILGAAAIYFGCGFDRLGWDDHYFRLAGTLLTVYRDDWCLFALPGLPPKEFFWLPKLALILAMPAIITYSDPPIWHC